MPEETVCRVTSSFVYICAANTWFQQLDETTFTAPSETNMKCNCMKQSPSNYSKEKSG